MKRTTLSLGIVAALALMTLLVMWLVGTDEPLRDPRSPRTDVVSTPESASPIEVVPPSTSSAPLAAVASEASPSGETAVATDEYLHEKIQRRLDALSQAYDAGDAEAADRALDTNHAVIRPNGKTMYRSDILAQWATEWTQLSNRRLSMQVESVKEEGDLITASWSVDLKANVVGDDAQMHDFEFGGTQVAVYRRQGDALLLEEPIRYTRAYQTIDGDAVNPYQ